MKVAVVGAGIVGLSAARFVANRGHAVTVFEQFPLFHDRGSSHGRTRIVRKAYPSRFWTGLMTEAYPMWAELEAECGRSLVTECGLLYFGHQDSPRIHEGIDSLTSLGVPHEALSPAHCAEKLSRLQLAPDEVGIFTPEAGFVRADLALQATHSLALAKGTTFVHDVADPDELVKEFDVVVLATGAWVNRFVPDLAAVPTRQTFAYVRTPITGAVWIDDTSLAYGFPSDESGAKIGAHEHGPVTNPDELGVPHSPHLGQIRETLKSRFGIDDPELQEVTTCIYTSTPDEMFRMGWITDQVVFVSSCSGHGFKLGPWVGRKLADIVEGGAIPEEFQ